jgi:hypothetical protein
MKKLILLLLFIPLVSFGQDGLGETIYDKLPETLYVSGIKIQDIPTKYMTMTLGTTLGAKLVGGNNFGNYFITLEWGQALLKKPNTKNKYYSHSSAVVTQQVPTENTRVFISTASVALNILDEYGWSPEFFMTTGDGTSWIMKKRD